MYWTTGNEGMSGNDSFTASVSCLLLLKAERSILSSLVARNLLSERFFSSKYHKQVVGVCNRIFILRNTSLVIKRTLFHGLCPALHPSLPSCLRIFHYSCMYTLALWMMVPNLLPTHSLTRNDAWMCISQSLIWGAEIQSMSYTQEAFHTDKFCNNTRENQYSNTCFFFQMREKDPVKGMSAADD